MTDHQEIANDLRSKGMPADLAHETTECIEDISAMIAKWIARDTDTQAIISALGSAMFSVLRGASNSKEQSLMWARRVNDVLVKALQEKYHD